MKNSLLLMGAGVVAILAAVLGADTAEAQAMPGAPLSVSHDVERPGDARYRDPPVTVEGRYVVITLEDHRLYLMEDERVIWSAVVGTGRGTQLENGRQFNFHTPRGMFRIQAREKDPVWNVPDWAFELRGEEIPPRGDPRRREPGMLGTTALYMEYGIAIHGTTEPENLGLPVSAGCIRMTNEDARRLYHDVEVGTPVIIY